MTDLAMDPILAAIDSDIEEQRAALAHYVKRLGRHDVTAIRCHEAVRTLRYLRSQIVRTSGWKPRLAA